MGKRSSRAAAASRSGRLRSVLLGFALLACVASACRAGDPEPKTPPNSPLPEVDRPKDPVPSPLGGDSGTGPSTSEGH